MHDFEHDIEIIVKENEEAAIVVWCDIYTGPFGDLAHHRLRLDDAIWVTHLINKGDGYYYWGHYDMTLEDAISDAKERNL